MCEVESESVRRRAGQRIQRCEHSASRVYQHMSSFRREHTNSRSLRPGVDTDITSGNCAHMFMGCLHVYACIYCAQVQTHNNKDDI